MPPPRIGLGSTAYKTDILPLNYGGATATGFEPARAFAQCLSRASP